MTAAGLRRRAGVTAATLAGATILVSALALTARAWWVAELLTHFRVQLVAAQLVLIGVLLATRFTRTALALTVCTALNWWYVQPVVWPEPRALATGAGSELDVMTVNVSARNERFDTLIATIERERPDLVLIVELTERWVRALETLADDFAYRELVPNDDAFGLGLLSRYPIRIASRGTLGATAAIDAYVDGPSGPFRVLGVHLRPPTSARLAAERNGQLTELAARRAAIDGPLIVLGDFNVSPYSPYYSDWVTETGLVDTLEGRGPSATWPSFMPVLGIPIDHCLVSEHFTVLTRRHLSEFGSDHYPVHVSLLYGTLL